MYEVVKTVNGYDICRMKGTRGFYHVTLEVLNNGCKKEVTFRTIKAAAEYIEKYL